MLGASAARDRRSARHEATRCDILAAAWELTRRDGLAALSLRELARAVRMQAPSLYSYFASKNAIYDAMFAEAAWQHREHQNAVPRSDDPLTELQTHMRGFLAFCVEDPQRYQLLFQRPIPGFEPSRESYAIAVETLELARQRLAQVGITDPAALDLLTAIGTGLADQQISNDPGGDRWVRLADEAMQMFFTHVTRQEGPRS